ncbi:hypothetical protein Cgig2_014364 [Carnegiea gigantea]|uniref:Autophagy-related protein 18b n=1 Tax=Carnegiea gigantea TaxID=171969 RepID=A0A9Q1KFA7_9CARY|nr:hypothetical protein Cgig2_014364 [Carnegiea gigantea]
MANQSSPYPILCASFNQDNSYFAVGTKLGFKIFQADTGMLCYEKGKFLILSIKVTHKDNQGSKHKNIGAFSIVEMRFSSSLLAIVGAGEQPALSPRRLCLFNTTTGAPLQELNFLTSVLAVRLNKQRLIVLLEDKTFIYDIDRLSILSTIDTIPNPKGKTGHPMTSCKLEMCSIIQMHLNPEWSDAALVCCLAGTEITSELLVTTAAKLVNMNAALQFRLSKHCLNFSAVKASLPSHSPLHALHYLKILILALYLGLCAFSHTPEACFLALPASTAKGSVLVYNVMDLHSHCEIEAHRSPLAAMVLSSDGAYLATASEQGTIVRVHTISEGTKYFSFRRGTYPSTIFSLSFGSSLELPDVLAATSSSGSLHVFMLASAINQRSRASGSFIGSIISGSISDVLDPAHHHVLHKAVPEGVRSYAVIRKAEKVVDNSTSQVLSFRVVISIISYNGYFQEYMLSVNYKNEAAWSLDREYNLLTAIPDTNPAS